MVAKRNHGGGRPATAPLRNAPASDVHSTAGDQKTGTGSFAEQPSGEGLK